MRYPFSVIFTDQRSISIQKKGYLPDKECCVRESTFHVDVRNLKTSDKFRTWCKFTCDQDNNYSSSSTKFNFIRTMLESRNLEIFCE